MAPTIPYALPTLHGRKSARAIGCQRWSQQPQVRSVNFPVRLPTSLRWRSGRLGVGDPNRLDWTQALASFLYQALPATCQWGYRHTVVPGLLTFWPCVLLCLLIVTLNAQAHRERLDRASSVFSRRLNYQILFGHPPCSRDATACPLDNGGLGGVRRVAARPWKRMPSNGLPSGPCALS